MAISDWGQRGGLKPDLFWQNFEICDEKFCQKCRVCSVKLNM